MKHFSGKSAVITGGGSGIGLALAEACVAEGMSVALVDTAADRLHAARDALEKGGTRVEAHVTDVSDLAAMRELAANVRASMGAVHLLVNNAGISGVHRWCWNFADDEWRRMIDINLRGVINGLQAFLPAMIDQGEGHVVNTASVAGLMATPMNAPYTATKFAVVGISEALSLDLREAGSRIGVSVLCPAMIRTSIGPHNFAALMENLNDNERRYNEGVAAGLAAGMDPAEVARIVIDAVRADRFYVLTHPEHVLPLAQRRTDAMRNGAPPTSPQQ